MTLARCIAKLGGEGKISPERIAEATARYDELLANYEPRFGRAAAEAMASEKALAGMERDFGRARRNAVLQARAQQRIADNAARLYDGGKRGGPIDPNGLVAHLVDDARAPFGNVEYRWKNIRDTAHRMIGDILWRHRSNVVGDARRASDFDDVVDALEGIDRGINAREMADAVKRTTDWLRARFNAAGGDIGLRDDWALPHAWDGVKVGLAKFETWRADILDNIDRAKMIDYATDEPMGDARLDQLLRDIYDQQVSSGEIGRTPSGAVQGRSMANRRMEARVLHFVPGGWRRVNEKYGVGGPYEALTHYIDNMARDTAAMEILGPNPDATIRWMKDLTRNTAFTSPSLMQRLNVSGKGREIDAIWEEITRRNREAVRPNVALFFSAVRNWQSATKLGSATLSSQADIATAALTQRFNGLPATAALRTIMGEFNPADGTHRAWARRELMINEEMIGRAAAFGRQHFNEDAGGAITAPTIEALKDGRISPTEYLALQTRAKLGSANEIARRASSGVIRASLLNQWTMRLRSAVNASFWNAITSYADLDYAGLNDGFRGFLGRYGIDAARWDALRSTPRKAIGDTEWIVPDNIADQDLRNRIVEGVFTELDYAVTTGGIRQRAALTIGRPGEIKHEVIKSGGQFLLFPITVLWRHGGRAWQLTDPKAKASYAGAFFIATTLMGALSEQLSELSRGKDPRPMTDENGAPRGDFWGKAISRGGALGYYGEIFDHVAAENGRTLKDIGNVPLVGSIDNWTRLVIREPVKAARGAMGATDRKGEPVQANFAKAAARIARYEVPGDNLWYLRLAYERVLLDQLDELGGRSPGEAKRRMEQRAAEEGTRYFAPIGSGVGGTRLLAPDTMAPPDPQRAPDLTNAVRPTPVAPPPE